MITKKTSFVSAIILFAILCLLTSGCNSTASSNLSKEAQKTDKLFLEGKMFHLKQVVEFYDEKSNPIPHYYELWIAKDKALCQELDRDGNILQKIQDDGAMHISYQPDTLNAVKHESSRIFMINPVSLVAMEDYGVISGESYDYCKRDCRVYKLSNGEDEDEDEILLYVDEETGHILFCDAPLFCMKTASIEVLAFDDTVFSIPEGIKFK